MPPLKKPPKEDSDEKNRLMEVLSKYKDRTREKDETMIQAEQDWERFQQISASESHQLGGTESTTHLVKGLDVELLRKQREELILDSKVETRKPARRDPETLKANSDMARKIINMLSNPNMLRKDRVDYEERKKELFKKISKLGPREKLESFCSNYFDNTRFVFRDDSEAPIVVMRSQEEAEEDRARRERMNLVRIRRDPECIEIVKEALKRIKSVRRKRLQQPPLRSRDTQAKDEDDEIDIFQDLALDTERQRRPEVTDDISTQPLFSQEPQQAALPLPAPSKAPPCSPKKRRQEEDEIFGEPLEFGAKLDLSRFRDAEEDDAKSKKQRGGNEKQIFQQVMKKVDKMK